MSFFLDIKKGVLSGKSRDGEDSNQSRMSNSNKK